MNAKKDLNHLLALKNEELQAAKMRFTNVIEQNADGILILNQAGMILFANPASQKLLGRELKQLVGSEFGFPIAKTNTELTIHKTGGEIRYVEMRVSDSEWNNHPVSLISLRDITDRKMRQKELEIISSMNNALRTAEDVDAVIQAFLEEIVENLHANGAAFWMEEDTQVQNSIHFAFGSLKDETREELDLLVQRTQNDPSPDKKSFTMKMELAKNQGTLGMMYLERNTPFGQFDHDVMTAVSEIASSSLHRSILSDETERRMAHLSALRDIDLAIASSLDVNVIMKIVIGHIQKHVGGDAICAFIYEIDSSVLVLSAETCMRRNLDTNLRMKLSGDLISSAIMDHQMIQVDSINEANLNPRIKKILQREQMESMQILPLYARGKSLGVVLVLHQGSKDIPSESVAFANALVTQASIGIDNASLFSEIQSFNKELRKAYDDTIEGWARAVNLRNRETAEHTRRVAEMALTIAEENYSFSESELRDIWYGALLHDIGKIAVPDEILFKPGRLTDEEWEVMHRHPEAAYEMLNSIDYLKDALVIPLYHHEKWNGEGYPRQLSGEAIPFTARLFALVDVWDALVSDRPYRKAWSHERALNLIREQSGIHFDPEIVPIFLDFISKYNQGDVSSTILIVDDEQHILSSLERSLREKYDIHTTTDVDEAKKIMKENRIQIALVDQRMPVMTGVELLKHLREIQPNLVGILISGYTDTEALVEALNLGFVRGFIGKPWNMSDVHARIEEALDFYQLQQALKSRK